MKTEITDFKGIAIISRPDSTAHRQTMAFTDDIVYNIIAYEQSYSMQQCLLIAANTCFQHADCLVTRAADTILKFR